jgi:ABC-type phosphate transport system substrate-binding protein
MQANTNSITFVNYADAVRANVSWVNMINRANHTVTPSVASVQAAMTSFQSYFSTGNFSIDILDAAGNSSWPMAYMSYFVMLKNVSVYDCTNIQELLNFVAWVQFNDQYMPSLPRACVRACMTVTDLCSS